MLTQPLFRYNELRWQKKIEPLKYEEARKTYLRDVENVRIRQCRISSVWLLHR